MKKILLILSIVLFAVQAWGTTYTVTSDAQMVSAIAALSDGDDIIINGSWTSSQEYLISTANIDIHGAARTNKITKGHSVGTIIKLNAAGCTVRDFTVDGDKDNHTGSGIGLAKTNGTASGMIIQNIENKGILLYNGQTGNTIDNCQLIDVGNSESSEPNAIHISTADETTVTNCTITSSDNWTRNGIMVYDSKDCVITDNTVTGMGSNGIIIYKNTVDPSGNSVLRNTITDFAQRVANDGIFSEGTSNIIAYNSIHQNTNGATAWGIEIAGNQDECDDTEIYGNIVGGLHLDKGLSGGGSRIIVKHNIISGLLSVDYENVDSSLFYSNVLIGTGSATCVEFDSKAITARSITFSNNTLINRGSCVTGLFLNETDGTWNSSTLVENNIIHGFTTAFLIDDLDDGGILVVHDYNSFYNNTANIKDDDGAGVTIGAHSITTNPRVTSTCKLYNNSPCKASKNPGIKIAGVNGTGTTDLWDNAGADGAIPIGAYFGNGIFPRMLKIGNNPSSIFKVGGGFGIQ